MRYTAITAIALAMFNSSTTFAQERTESEQAAYVASINAQFDQADAAEARSRSEMADYTTQRQLSHQQEIIDKQKQMIDDLESRQRNRD